MLEVGVERKGWEVSSRVGALGFGEANRALFRHCQAGSPVELLWRGKMPKGVFRKRLTESLVTNHLVMQEAWAFQEKVCMAARGVSWWTSTQEGVEKSKNEKRAANRSIKVVLGTLCQNQEGQSPAEAGTAQGHWWGRDRICRHASWKSNFKENRALLMEAPSDNRRQWKRWITPCFFSCCLFCCLQRPTAY